MDTLTKKPAEHALRGAVTVGMILSGAAAWVPPLAADITFPTYSVAEVLTVSNGTYPTATGLLAQGRDGRVYGTTPDGGAHSCGTAFRMNSDGSAFKVLYNFPSELCHPKGGLTLGNNGLFYGTSQGVGRFKAAIFWLSMSGQQHAVIHSFSPDEGANPESPPIQWVDGRFYGVTSAGGQYNDGTLYQIRANGDGFQKLYDFQSSMDGANPMGPLAIGADGVFYGTASYGGPTAQGQSPMGTLYSFDQKKGVAVLHTFQYDPFNPAPNTSAHPNGPLTRGADGSLLGTTYGFYTTYNAQPGKDYGAIFRWHGQLDTYLFDPIKDTMNPAAGLTPTPWGYVGAGSQQAFNPGSLYYYDGSDFNTVETFQFIRGLPNTGATPESTLLQHTNGNLFGTTLYGGANATGFGTVYKLTNPLVVQNMVSPVPQAAKIGQVIGLLGQGFQDGNGNSVVTSVAFGAVPADLATIQVSSGTFLTVKVPVGATSGNIVVTLSGGVQAATVLPFPVVSSQ